MICRNCGHYGVTNRGFVYPVNTICSVFPKPYNQNIAFKITLNILEGQHSILAGFGPFTSKRVGKGRDRKGRKGEERRGKERKGKERGAKERGAKERKG